MTVVSGNRGYPAKVMIRAGELVRAGYTPREAAAILEKEQGVTVDHRTVSLWANPDRWARRREKHMQAQRVRNAVRRGGRLGTAKHTVELQEYRARQLAALPGTTRQGVARFMDFDYPGQGWTRHRVELLLGPRKEPARHA